ncbi:putative heat shock protein Hsp88 [Lineolata rhizophorae]|uniref:Putative heat shock protein Hsp88 n=1 Tax=Lineolata rhizophorae TaxID=578093 RepID=A0A6A6NX08_9PEZI|nr:putative heat shock protein Hsp88 [Lineolata rhizophorae]
MSVVGVDLGTLNTVIAVARNRGVDVITNEVSNRATPSLVGFGPKARYLGETAKTQEISNLKNTVGCLTRLAGRSLKDPDVQVEQDYVSAPLVDINGQVGAEVTYMGKKEQFTATQLIAMFLAKVKQTASAELKLPVSDVVLSCPAWYTDTQRRSLLDAAEIAGLKLLRLINDTTATALGYGITKLDLPTADEKPRRVTFVDIGHSNFTCSVVEFRKGELAVKSTVCDRHFGGRNFDKALVDHFAAEFKEKFKIDINENAKARMRVTAACEKLKKVLSANPAAPMSIESLMNDIDVKGFLKRDELEELMRPLLDRVTQPLEQALAEAKLKPEDIDSIEMVGGCTRVPAIKAAVHKFFGKGLSFTLNQDEAVARGCAFSCAILSPVFRVRDFSIHDIVQYPIEFTWEKSPDIPDEDTSLTVFNKGNVMPSTKILTYYRKQPFDLEAKYAKPEMLPGKMNPWIGRFSVKGVKADSKDDFMICKLKARLNVHGVLNVEQGYWVEDTEVEEPLPESKDDKKEGEKKDGDVRVSDFPSAVRRSSSVRDSTVGAGPPREGAAPAGAGGMSGKDFPPDQQTQRAKRARLDSAPELQRTAAASPSPQYHQPQFSSPPGGAGPTANARSPPFYSSFPHSTSSSFDPTFAFTSSAAQQPLTSSPYSKQEMDVDEKPKTRVVRKQVRKGDLPLSAGTASMDRATKEAAQEKENAMIMEDKLVADTEHMKNELEAFIYEMRGKIDDVYADFADEAEKTRLKEKLEQTEDWLYDEGEDATKAMYVAKMDEIRAIAGPIVQRYNDKIEGERQAALKAQEEAEAAKRVEMEARKAEDDRKKEEQEQARKTAEGGGAAAATEKPDEEMKDADGAPVRPDEIEEPEK